MLQLVQLSTGRVKVQDLWVPPRRINRMGCERCGLMAQYATWTVLGDGATRDAWLHIHCDYCYGHTDWDAAHAMKVEEFEQRKAASRGVKPIRLARVVGL